MSNEPNFGPDKETLRRLSEGLPDFVEQREQKRIFAGQKPVSKARAHKVCRVCGRLFDFRIIEKTDLPEIGICPEKCQKELDNGYIAFISANQYAFGESKSLSDLSGTVVECSPPVMQALQDMLDLEWSVKEEPKDEDGPDAP